MKKLKMARGVTLTFEEGCNKYLENCRQRNLREGTINHYITFAVPSVTADDTSTVKINITGGDFGSNKITIRTGKTSVYLADDSYASVLNGTYTRVDAPIQ